MINRTKRKNKKIFCFTTYNKENENLKKHINQLTNIYRKFYGLLLVNCMKL